MNMDVKENLAKNLIIYRKANKLTQAELAEKINYSDKAVSKWERGEAVPDLNVLKQLADFYGTTIDTLLKEPKEEIEQQNNTHKNLPKKRLIICLCSAGLVWLVAIVAYSFIGVIFPNLLEYAWLSIIYAVPITFIVLLVLTSVWGKNIANAVYTSLLVWTTILAVFLSIVNLVANPGKTMWMMFLVGIPLQVLIILWWTYKKIK